MSATAPIPFEDVLHDLVDVSSGEFVSSLRLSRPALAALESDLLRLLSQICSWPLLAAFAVFRDTDARRFNDADAGIYRDFSRLLQRGALADFFLEFPELSRLVTGCIADWREANHEFLFRLEGDRAELTKVFGNGAAGQIVNLDPALSDRHGGRTVMGVTFESGLKLAYKPRDMALERSYFGLLSWLNAQGAPLDQRVLLVLEKSGYGWAEWVQHEPCRHENDLRDYFTRAGALQCVFYVLHATDAHMGNVLAAGGYPVMVDAECLLQPRRFAGESDPEHEALEDLLSAAFLPRPRLVRGDAPDFSGLGGDSGRPTEFRIPLWRDVNTDSMSVRFVPGILVSQKNAPVLNGVRAEMRNYSAEFLAGFESMYRFLAERRQRLLSPEGPLEPMFSCQSRVLLRSTRACVSVINRSLHPRYLRDPKGRAAMLREWVGRYPLDLSSEILDKEAETLGSLNVPYFRAAPNDLALDAESGASMPGYFHVTGREMVTRRLHEMDGASLQRQLGLLGSLLTLSSLSG
jgi:type 2 lantibiotic biosynthesis protein LanM